ncbi:cdkn1a interacting zinc finger protein 1b isoform X4 [Melanotaenia boesemani]|uniref:cdkn1a interacting zinc finger protein 1b isoform X4 n=1 Tax=Melanotaenia boesemani TaxID=1250792 RepID=UPI001C03C633|nr:cdkn1a interacting zinc finger protein 1b isoform X4 [Melanotaenia boesemani]
MVKRRTDRSFLPAAGCSVTRVRFPVCPAQRALPPTHQASETGNSDGWPRCSSTSTEERTGSDGWNQLGDPGSDGGSGETESKRGRQDGNEQAATPTNRDGVPGSCDPAGDVPGPDQQGAAEDSRAAELQSTGSLKVTIQRSSDSREFGQTDKTTERQTCGLHCYVCNLTCRSAQVFQEHMSGQEHLRKLQEITHCIHLNTNTLLDRGRRSETQRWCDSCQIHFSGDVIKHRRTRQHKVCKQLCRPFCPVCKRHFRTPRKFVEHMKSAEHKQQVQLQEAQEDELITVDAVGCFQEEKEEEEAEVADEEDEGRQEPKEVESEDVASWFLCAASCVDSATSSSTEKLQLDTHTAGHTHTASTCRATELVGREKRRIKTRTDLPRPELFTTFPTMHQCLQAMMSPCCCSS